MSDRWDFIPGVTLVALQNARPLSRRPFQFGLRHLLVAVLACAVLLGLIRLGDLAWLVIFGGSIISYIVLGSAAFAARARTHRLTSAIARGALAGAVFASLILGWMTIPFFAFEGPVPEVIGISASIPLGGMVVGSLVGTIVSCWPRLRARFGRR